MLEPSQVCVNMRYIPSEARLSHYALSPFLWTNIILFLNNIHVLTFHCFGLGFYFRPSNRCETVHGALRQKCLDTPDLARALECGKYCSAIRSKWCCSNWEIPHTCIVFCLITVLHYTCPRYCMLRRMKCDLLPVTISVSQFLLLRELP